MFAAEFQGTLLSATPLAAEDITNLIEVLVDTLDELGFEVSVRTNGVGTDVGITVEVLAP